MKITKEMENNHFFGIPGSGVPLDLMDNGIADNTETFLLNLVKLHRHLFLLFLIF